MKIENHYFSENADFLGYKVKYKFACQKITILPYVWYKSRPVLKNSIHNFW